MNSLSKSKIKYIKSLQLKKNRMQDGKFIVEGNKSVREFLVSDYIVEEIIGTTDFYESIDQGILCGTLYHANAKTLATLGSLKSNNAVLAIVKIKHEGTIGLDSDSIMLAVDRVNDPGNLGTIIRIADWYGIKNLLLSKDSVDMYNPKVVSATKGSLTRVNIHYGDLISFFREFKGPILAADLQGEPLNKVEPVKSGIILMGSESHGIDHDLEPFIVQKITIPRKGGAESLNLAVATGIICQHFLGSQG